VAEKLGQLFKKDRKKFEEKWESLNIFIKYGIITDEKFYEKAKNFTLLENTESKFYTFDEYKTEIEKTQKDKDGNLVYLYTTDPAKQDAFIQPAINRSYQVLKMDGMLDNHFINNLEMKLEKTRWKRVDSDSIDKLVEKDEQKESVLTKDEEEKVKKIFTDAINNTATTVELQSLAVDDLPVTVIQPEFMRRMKDMSKLGGGPMMMGGMPDQLTAVVNANHSLVSGILKEKSEDKQKELALQAYELGLLSQNMLDGNALTKFIQRSVDLISKN
jgi:molecular chaperone HtpG